MRRYNSRYFYETDQFNRIVPATLVRRFVKPKNGAWKEACFSEDINDSIQKGRLKAFVRFDSKGQPILGSLILSELKPKIGKWKVLSSCTASGGAGSGGGIFSNEFADTFN